MRVLLADDDEIIQSIVDEVLLSMGYEVRIVDNGLSAWEIMNHDTCPPIVILDWMMPEMEGVEICRKIREQTRSDYVYIILLTSKDSTDNLVEGMNAGADDYLKKPFSTSELGVRVEAGKRLVETQAYLRNTLSRLEEANEMRKNFAAAIAHDLRTPLIAEKRTLSLLNESTIDEATRQMLTEGLIKNNNDLLKMMNMLLNAYHYDSAEIQLIVEPVNLSQLVIECFENLSVLAAEKSISLINNVPDNCLLGLDKIHFYRVLQNLVGNALHNIPEACTVSVSAVECSDGSMNIVVEDNGQGIDEALLPKIFNRYYTGLNKQRKIGSGLGLFICKTIVELHHGAIVVENKQGGSGTRFTISMPLENNNAMVA